MGDKEKGTGLLGSLFNKVGVPTMFKKSFTPDPKKTFLENYSAHLNYLENEFSLLSKKMRNATLGKQLDHILNATRTRFKMFEQYKDRYDITDDVLGATVAPLAGLVISIVELCKGIWEGAQALYLHVRYGEDQENAVNLHAENAIAHFTNIATVFVAAAAATLLSMSNLIFRPFVTMVNGFAKSESDRFQAEHDINNTIDLPNPTKSS